MIGLGAVYWLAGLLFAGVALASALDTGHPRRGRAAAFWGLLSLSLLAGDRLGDLGNGLLVAALVLLAASGAPGCPAGAVMATGSDPDRPGNRLLPVLAVPALTLFGVLVLSRLHVAGLPLLDPHQAAPVSLAIASLAALLLACLLLRPGPAEPVQAMRGILEQIGAVMLLPQLLSALGAVLAGSGVGHAVGLLVGPVLPEGSRVAAVCAYAGGMALLTVLTGNAFAAFPVMSAAIGVPLLIRGFGADAAAVGAIGMLCGFCGTLLTPLAANFNLVPAALLDLPGRWWVIRAQAPTALLLLLANTLLLLAFAFP